MRVISAVCDFKKQPSHSYCWIKTPVWVRKSFAVSLHWSTLWRIGRTKFTKSLLPHPLPPWNTGPGNIFFAWSHARLGVSYFTYHLPRRFKKKETWKVVSDFDQVFKLVSHLVRTRKDPQPTRHNDKKNSFRRVCRVLLHVIKILTSAWRFEEWRNSIIYIDNELNCRRLVVRRIFSQRASTPGYYVVKSL